jgi:carbon storage regulator
MLNLARNVGQTIMIGDHIRIVVVAIKRNQVCLGIEAPQEVSVHRSEIYERIQNGKNLNFDLEIEIDDADYDYNDDVKN